MRRILVDEDVFIAFEKYSEAHLNFSDALRVLMDSQGSTPTAKPNPYNLSKEDWRDITCRKTHGTDGPN